MRNRFLVIAIAIAILMTGGACIHRQPAPSPVPAPKPLPSSPTSLPPPLSPSLSPTPQPSPTLPPEIEKGLLVLSYSTYVDTFGNLHVVGEVENIGVNNTEKNQITATFIDAEGNPVVSASTYSYLDIITPQQKSPFEIVFLSPPDVTNYKLELSWKITTRARYSGIECIGDSLQLGEGNWGQLIGEVKNNGSQKADRVIIVATFYNKSGEVIGAGFTKAKTLPLAPGETSPFTIVVNPKVAMNTETYSLQVESSVEG